MAGGVKGVVRDSGGVLCSSSDAAQIENVTLH